MTCEQIADRWDGDVTFADRDFGDGVFAYGYNGFDILRTNQQNDAFRVDEDDNLTVLFEAIAKALVTVDSNIQQSYQDRFLDCASGDALDMLAKPVDVSRKADENDANFRTRVKTGYGRAASDTTLSDFTAIVLDVLQTTANDIGIRGSSNDTPVVIVETDVDVVEASLFSESEIVDLLNSTVASAHNVEIETTGTFEFDGDNYSPSSNTGFGDGTFGGTID